MPLLATASREPGTPAATTSADIDTIDGIERAMLQARVLIDSTMSMLRRRVAKESVAIVEEALVGDTVGELIGLARHSVSAFLPVSRAHVVAFCSALAVRGPHPAGATVRLLCTPECVSTAVPGVARLLGARCEIRVVDGELLREMLIVDGRSALVQSDAARGSSATIVRDPASVRAMEMLFAGTWANARPLEDYLRLNEHLQDEITQCVLNRLRSGQTDAVAAGELTMSLRTYRRHVMKIIRELGVRSRFQAGARAVEMGLLRSTECDMPMVDEAVVDEAVVDEVVAEGAVRKHPVCTAASVETEKPTEDRVAPAVEAELPGDCLERSLLEASRLIEETVVQHRDRLRQESLITAVKISSEGNLRAEAELMVRTELSIDIVLGDVAAADGEFVEAVRVANWMMTTRPDVAVRLLCTQSVFDSGVVPIELLEQGNQVRIARIPKMRLILVDGVEATVTAQSILERRTSVVRAPSVIRTLGTLFEKLWGHGVPAEDMIDFGDEHRTTESRRILDCMAAGLTDECAARGLSVSVRTYRRYVAETMALLDAGSRFEAGARAAEVGLLPLIGSAGSNTPLQRAILSDGIDRSASLQAAS